MNLKACLVFLMFFPTGLYAQVAQGQKQNHELFILLDSLQKTRDDSLRIKLNKSFYDKLHTAIASDVLNFSLPDSFKISNVASEDDQLRILSWNIQQNNGENHYSGFIIHKPLQAVIPLGTKKSEPVLPQDTIFRNGSWPGGIIYRIITRRFSRQTSYTLLIWDGFDRRTNRKYIEALSFDEKGKAVFGAPVFKIKEGIRNRIVNEYSSSASFSMQYNRQKVTLSGVRKSQRNIDDEMIVTDRLIPLNADLAGQRWAYVPAGNTYDAYIYFDGYWTLALDIAPRNKPSARTTGKSKEKPELDLYPSDKKP